MPDQEAGEHTPLLKDSLRSTIAKQKTCNFCGITIQSEDAQLLQILIVFMVILCGGAYVFSALEWDLEMSRIREAHINDNLDKAAVMKILDNHDQYANTAELFDALKNHPDAFTPPDTENHWTYSSSLMFSFTIVTTIGYGTFAPSTTGGQLFLVGYALVGIPLAGMALALLAHRALRIFTYLFSIGTDRINNAFDEFDTSGDGLLSHDEVRVAVQQLGITLSDKLFWELIREVDRDNDGEVDREEFVDVVSLLNANVTEVAGRKRKIFTVVAAIIIWCVVGMATFTATEGWDWQQALYFSFVTLTTIGLGDFFPESRNGMIMLVVYAMIGLGMLAALLSLIEELFRDIENAEKEAKEQALEQTHDGNGPDTPHKTSGATMHELRAAQL